MAKSEQKIRAIKLRKTGKSIGEIAKEVGVSKSTASIWCRDVLLEEKQILVLQQRSGWGRIKGSNLLRERRLKEISELEHQGREMIKSIDRDNLLFLGAGLYWGEGSKTERTGISNSDPRILGIAIKWLEKIWGIKKDDFHVYVNINKIHEKRVKEVEEYWSKQLGIPLGQFRRTTLIKTNNKKVYANFNEHYGTVMMRVRRSKNLLYKIKGLISCLYDKVLLSS